MDKISTILLIDDQPSNLALLQALLQDEGYRLLTALNAEQALNMLEREQVDVVLSDVLMPGMSGFDLCREIRRQPALEQMPVLLVTSLEDGDSRLHGLRAGADDFISKPIEPAELRARLRTITRLNRFRLLAEQSERLAFLELYDSLTLLPNEHYLQQCLPGELRQVQQLGHALAILYIDLDGFQMINNTLGSKTAGQLVQEVAARLKLLTETDTYRQLLRVGVDKFVIIQKAHCSLVELSQLADSIQQAIKPPITLQDRELRLSASIGISMFPADGKDSETLLAAASMSMMLSRQQGRGGYQFVSRKMNAELRERLNLEQELQQALERDELYLAFQPKVTLNSGQLHSVEALVRWQHPQQGNISPQRFISIAEDSGLIVPISNWVLNSACRQLKSWRDTGYSALSVAVNISSWEFVQQDLVDTVQQALAAYQLPGHTLELELTESVIMAEIGKNQRKVIQMLQDLKALGVKLAIDDFGTGYSALSYLKRFPVDLLKIDQIFIREIPADRDDTAIVRAIIELAHSLRLQVIAEGIETAAQRDFLQKQGCDYGQGNLFSPARAPEDLEQWWQKHSAALSAS